MRKTLIGGSLLAVLLLMTLPAVAAEQAKITQSANTPYLQNLEATYLQALQEKYNNGASPQIIFITLAILLLKLLRWGVIIVGGIILLSILGLLRKPQNNTSALL